MRIVDSIIARYRNFKAKHWHLFPEGQYIASLKNIHKGKRCFIIGNGSSLTVADLNKIADNGEITFGFNRIYKIFPETNWRPTYYFSQDYKTILCSCPNINAIEIKPKFIPIEAKWDWGLPFKRVKYFNIQNIMEDNRYAFSDDVSKYVVASNTVTYTAIQFAVYMGITDIYMIGIDHSFQKVLDSEGNIIEDPNAKDYFIPNYTTEQEDVYIPRLDLSTLTYVSAKEYADSHNINIYNATRGGKLEVFPRVDFDSLFNSNQLGRQNGQ